MRVGAVFVVMGLVVLLPGVAGAGRLAPADLPWLDPEEAAALLADLEEAGMLPADLDLAGLEMPASENDGRAPRPSWTCRLESTREGQVKSWLDGRAGPVELRLRARRGPDDRPQAGGCLWLEDPRWAVAAGGVGVQHGLGLLAAGPGRNRSASIGGTLLPGTPGPRHWSSPDPATGLRGVAVEWRGGPVVAGAMVGRPEAAAGARISTERTAWLAARRRGLTISVLTSPGTAGQDRSLAIAAGEGRLDLRLEAAAWRDATSAARASASAVAVRWRGKGVSIEALAATAAAPAAPRSGSRPACLIGWDGSGWAARGRLALGAGVSGTVLAAAAGDRPARTLAQDRLQRQTVEAGVAGRIAPAGTWSLRWRHREDLRWTLDAAAPWQPPTRGGREVADSYVAEATLPGWSGEFAGAVRCAARAAASGDGRRWVASLLWRGPCGPLRATLGGTWAWGDPVAAATVTTPVSGLAVPRSWSQWSGEVQAGADLVVGSWRIQVAATRRTASLPAAVAPSWQGWLRLAVAW